MLNKFKKVVAAIVSSAYMAFYAHAQEVPYDYKDIALGMTAEKFFHANPEQFPVKLQSEFGKEFRILHILLTPKVANDCGLMGGKDCYHVSAVLSQPETGSSVVQQINVSQTYRSGPTFDKLSPHLFAKYGEPRIKFEQVGGNGFVGGSSGYYVWGGRGELLHKDQGVVTFEKLSGKYVVAEVLQNLFNERVSGYRLQIVDTDLKAQSAAVLKRKLIDENGQ
jgi:hypothetical protein